MTRATELELGKVAELPDMASGTSAEGLPGHWPRQSLVAIACLLAFGLLWLIELYAVQSVTLITNHSGGPRFDRWAPVIRFAIDALFVASLVSILRVRWLACIAVLGLLLNMVLVAYANYFQRPLTMTTVLGSYREGAAVSQFILDWLPVWPTAAMIGVCLAQLGLLWRARKLEVSQKVRWSGFAFFAVSFIALYAATLWINPLHKILTTQGVARLAIIRGYAGPWLAELYYTRDPRITQAAINRAKIRSDQLTPQEATIPIQRRLAIVQVETLDYNVLGKKVNGQEVTPFLNRLRDAAMFYRAKSYITIGSADADFAMLMDGPSAMNVLNYSLAGFRYDDSLPHFLAARGFVSAAFHGNNGTFYSRRVAFEKMGFSQLFFREELEPLGAFTADAMGLRDGDVLAFSARLLRQATVPTCHFVITLTSHTPYRFIAPDNYSPVPRPHDAVDRYFNHIHYTDTCLRDYITALGKGVTVVFYGDHPTEVSRDDFMPATDPTGKYVPVFIYDTDQNLAKLQQTRGGLAESGELKVLDIATYLRNEIAQSWPVTASEAEKAEDDHS